MMQIKGAHPEVAEQTARRLFEVEAVRFYDAKPFIFTSGWASPVYIDCRRPISFPEVRRAFIADGAALLRIGVGEGAFDAVAGGETAGIPYAAWMAEALDIPMQYARKKPKGFGRNAQVEGQVTEGHRTLLVEDLATDGRSKVVFCKALRDAGAVVDHVFVVFFYSIFQDAARILSDMGVSLHHLATWWDVLAVAKADGRFAPSVVREVESFLHDPAGWSKANGGVDRAPD